MSAINYAFVWVLALTSLAHRVHNLTHLCLNTIDYRCYMSSHRIRMSGKKDKKIDCDENNHTNEYTWKMSTPSKEKNKLSIQLK